MKICGFTVYAHVCIIACCMYVVDGGWSNWLVGKCSVTCIKNKTRSCSNPVPSCGGKDCSGPAVEVVKCNEFPCEGLLNI